MHTLHTHADTHTHTRTLTQDSAGKTALHYAVERKDEASRSAILAAKTNPNLQVQTDRQTETDRDTHTHRERQSSNCFGGEGVTYSPTLWWLNKKG